MKKLDQDVLLIEQTGPVKWITLNRPEKCNALNTDINAALINACRSLTRDVAVLVLRGAGTNFCAGSDLMDLHLSDRHKAESVIKLEIEACHALAEVSQLTIAVLHGKCYGGGAILPLYCDLRIGYSGVEFALPEISLGWIPPYGMQRLLTGTLIPFALDVLLTGRVCHDKEALENGWLQRLADSEEEVSRLIDRLAQIPRQTLIDVVALVRSKELPATKRADALTLEAFLNHFDTDHARNHIALFMERKRVSLSV